MERPGHSQWVNLLRRGGEQKYHEKLKVSGKLFARERVRLLCDRDSFVEEALFANCVQESLPSDGVVTGLGRVAGRAMAVMANDSTVKAGSWGARTVEKIIRIQETAKRLEVPLFYLVDSAGARITDQVAMFPGRHGAGRIFYNQSCLSGKVPQICLLLGPSAAGGAYIPAFCDVVFMVEGNASMYLGSPRMAEAVIGEKITLEEMGGARMHCSVSGCGDFLVKTEQEAIEKAKVYLGYLPQNHFGRPGRVEGQPPEIAADKVKGLIPQSPARAYDMGGVIKAVVDRDTYFEIKALYAQELLTGFARIDGWAVGIIANQPLVKGGVLFVESSDKAARFIQLCDSFSIPIVFLADVPGFMIGSQVEREGIIRAGAKMIYAMSVARVPKLSLIVRKAYGAGLYAMSGPAFNGDCVLALPSAHIAVMGAEPAINAVYFNKMEAMEPDERKAFMAKKVEEYEKDVDIYRLASELVVDHIVDFHEIRSEIVKRLNFAMESGIHEKAPSGISPM